MCDTAAEGRPERVPAVVNFEPGKVERREVPVPEPKEGEVLLRVEAVGICGSDVHQWHGTHSWEVNYPVTLGHEFAGVVVEPATGTTRGGEGEDTFAVGDRVVSETAAIIDETNPLTRQGKYHLDPNRLGFGYGVDGAMTEYVAVPERCLHHIPDDLPFEQAALTEPCSVAYSAVVTNGDVNPGDDVLVIGPGQIGQLATTMARESGASNVVVSGLPKDKSRLEIAREMGATETLTGDIPAFAETLGDGLGFDCVVDASGVMATFETAMDVVRPDGHITKVGWGPEDLEASLDPIVQKAVTVQGSFSHTWAIWEKVLTMLSTGQIDVEPIVGHEAPLSEWEHAFEGMHDREFIKAVLRPGDA